MCNFSAFICNIPVTYFIISCPLKCSFEYSTATGSIKQEGGGDSTLCYCDSDFSSKNYKSSTSNLKKHLWNRNPISSAARIPKVHIYKAQVSHYFEVSSCIHKQLQKSTTCCICQSICPYDTSNSSAILFQFLIGLFAKNTRHDNSNKFVVNVLCNKSTQKENLFLLQSSELHVSHLNKPVTK
jgi:hypothetical protein